MVFASYGPTEAMISDLKSPPLNHPKVYLFPATGMSKQLHMMPGYFPETLPVTAANCCPPAGINHCTVASH